MIDQQTTRSIGRRFDSFRVHQYILNQINDFSVGAIVVRTTSESRCGTHVAIFLK